MQYTSLKYPLFFLTLCLTLSATVTVPADDATGRTAAYIVSDTESTLIHRFAPVFLIEENDKSFNRIGTPAASMNKRGREEIYVDPDRPTVYTATYTFATDRGRYTNLFYRVHFERSPFTWTPFNPGAGKNVGAIVVVTLNSEDQPVFISTVQSCGCYHAIVPTNYLPQAAYPETWSTAGQEVYGEHLPGHLDFSEADRLVVTIRSGTHRTMDLRVASHEAIREFEEAETLHVHEMDALKHLPLAGGETSFYHTKGRRRGLVKGAYKPWETVLFGLWAWDSHVGQDREYGPKDQVGHRFYTTLRFSKKKRADMWDYAGYLRHNGWKP